MNYNDVLKLIDAGFSAEEIRGMIAPEVNNETGPVPAEMPTATPIPASAELPPEVPAPDQDAQTLEALKDTINELSGTIKELQRDNARGAVEPKRETPEEKTLTIIGDFMKSM